MRKDNNKGSKEYKMGLPIRLRNSFLQHSFHVLLEDTKKSKEKALRKGKGDFEQKRKPLKQSSIYIKVTEDSLRSFHHLINCIMATVPSGVIRGGVLFSQIVTVIAQSVSENFYFATPAGGRDVLITKQGTALVNQILSMCGTDELNATQITPVIRTILTLCDGSLIQALNGSFPLNITTDPALRCINNQFDTQCSSSPDDGSSEGSVGYYVGYAFAIAIPILIICCCIAGIKKCCCDQPLSSDRERLMPGPRGSSSSSRDFELQQQQIKETRKMRKELEEINSRARWDAVAQACSLS